MVCDIKEQVIVVIKMEDTEQNETPAFAGVTSENLETKAESQKQNSEIPEEASVEQKDDSDDILREFLSEVSSLEREDQVNRILNSFKLDPFHILDLFVGASATEVKKQYRKLSLLVHPDKCKHEKAQEAFDILARAQKDLLDEEKRGNLLKYSFIYLSFFSRSSLSCSNIPLLILPTN